MCLKELFESVKRTRKIKYNTGEMYEEYQPDTIHNPFLNQRQQHYKLNKKTGYWEKK